MGILLILVLFIQWLHRRAHQRRPNVEREGPFSYLVRNLRDYGWWPFRWRLQRDLAGHGPAESVEGEHGYHLQTSAERAAAQASGSAPANGYGRLRGGDGGRRRNGVHLNTDHGAGNQRQADQILWQERKAVREHEQHEQAAASHRQEGASRLEGGMQIVQAKTHNPRAERAREGQSWFPASLPI